MTTESRTDIEIDPQIRDFVAYLQGRSEKLSGSDSLSYSERREIAEKVRRPLTMGGPAIEKSCDYRVPVGSGDVGIRIINAAAGDHTPALIYVHGGGWMLFSIDTHDRIMRELAAQSGIAVIGVDYSLSPEARYPVQINEIQAVVQWLRENDIVVGIDSSRLFIGGDSAGANLAVSSCLALKDASDLNGILGMMLFYGVYDARFDTNSYQRYGDPKSVLSKNEMQDFWECYVRSPDDYSDPLVSPLHADLRGLPPALMAIAELDVLHDENLEMAARLGASGIEVQSEVYQGTTHSFLEAMSMADVSRRALSDSARWLQKQLGSA